VKTRLAAPARLQADRLDRWWREHRPDVADLFARELDAPRELIGDAPEAAGAPHVERGETLVRRILLPKTNNHVYYEIDRDKRRVMILAVWGAPTGRGPSLPRSSSGSER
jgi:hypothetical protein